MPRLVFFDVLLFLALGSALARGGRPERATAVVFIVALAATIIVIHPYALRYKQLETGVMLVDFLTFVALVWIALIADRFWTMPVAAIQGISIVGHAVVALRADVFPQIYLNAVQLWSWPQLLLLILGVARFELRGKGWRLGSWPLLVAPPDRSLA